MLTFSQLLALLAHEPVALWGDWLRAFAASGRWDTMAGLPIEARVTPQTQRAVAQRSGAIAVIPVQGIITAKPTMWEHYGFTMSVQSLVAATRAAVNDPEVKSVVWDMNTPGGSTSGVAEGHADLMALRGKKPITAQVNYMSASAGYWLASAADEIASAPSAVTGSVGAYMMHMDVSKAMTDAGMQATFIHAGRDKVLGNEFEPLSDEGRAYYQGLVDNAYASFTGDVATGRNMSTDIVRGESFGMGRILTADAAKRAGMIDVIRTMDQTLAAYGATTSTGDRQRRALSLQLLELE
jgi:signal peptide peptidase SppA